MSKTFSVRMPETTPDISSEQVAAWLDCQLASNAPLAPDPGPGERTFRFSLDHEQVKAGATAAEEPEAAVFVRRLIASNIHIPEEPIKAEPEAKPKPPVLKGALRLQPDQVKPLVRVFEAGQSYVIRRALKAPDAFEEASFSEDERDQLAVSATEVINRRAPAAIIQNADVLGLATTIVAIEARKIEAVQAVAERTRREPEQQAPPQQEG